MWDKLIFWPVRKELGGKIRLVIVGSAPLGSFLLLIYYENYNY